MSKPNVKSIRSARVLVGLAVALILVLGLYLLRTTSSDSPTTVISPGEAENIRKIEQQSSAREKAEDEEGASPDEKKDYWQDKSSSQLLDRFKKSD